MTDKPESETTAGLAVGEVLPVVAVASGDDLYRSEDCVPFGRLSPAGPPLVALTAHAPAQTIIERLTQDRDELREIASQRGSEIMRLTRERDHALMAASCEATAGDEARDALKAKQVADIDEVMRLADEYAGQSAALAIYGTEAAEDRKDAAREALRSALTKEPETTKC